MTLHIDNVVPFRPSGGAPARAPATPPTLSVHAHRDITLGEIAARLGICHQDPRTIVSKLRTLARFEGFPLPRTLRFWQGRPVTGPRLIVAGSIWDRYLVDCWFDHRHAPADRVRLATAERERVRGALAARAAHLANAGRPL